METITFFKFLNLASKRMFVGNTFEYWNVRQNVLDKMLLGHSILVRGPFEGTFLAIVTLHLSCIIKIHIPVYLNTNLENLSPVNLSNLDTKITGRYQIWIWILKNQQKTQSFLFSINFWSEIQHDSDWCVTTQMTIFIVLHMRYAFGLFLPKRSNFTTSF